MTVTWWFVAIRIGSRRTIRRTANIRVGATSHLWTDHRIRAAGRTGLPLADCEHPFDLPMGHTQHHGGVGDVVEPDTGRAHLRVGAGSEGRAPSS